MSEAVTGEDGTGTEGAVTSRGPRRRRWLIIGASLAVAGVAVAVGVVVAMSRSSDDSAAEVTDRVDPLLAQRTLDYLEGDGAPVMAFTAAVRPLAAHAEPDLEVCDEVSLEATAVTADADELRTATLAVPDPVLMEDLLGTQAAAIGALQSCDGDPAYGDDQQGLVAGLAAVDARLAVLKASR